MQFGQIVKELLNRNNSVWLPQFGLLRYEEGSSRLIFDSKSIGSEDAVVAQLSQRGNISLLEARTLLRDQIDFIKRSIASNGKYNLEGVGEIIEFDNAYQILEERKSLFPSDFFGMSSFDFSENKKSTDSIEKIETPEVIMPLDQEKKDLVEESIQKPLRSELDSFIEESKQKLDDEQVNTNVEKPSLFDDLVAKVKSTTKKKLETVEEATLFSSKIEEPVKEERLAPPVVEEIEKVDPVEEIVLQEETPISEPEAMVVEEISVEEPATVPVVETEPEPEIVYEQEPEIEEEPEINPADIVRRNIGRANYDEGYYEHLVTNKSSKMAGIRLGRVLPIVAGLAIIAFFVPWIIASFQGKYFLGMNPLFSTSKKQEVKTIVKAVPAIDTAKKDTALLAKADTMMVAKAEEPVKPISEAQKQPTVVSKLAPIAPATTIAKSNTTTSASPKVEKPTTGTATKSSSTKTQNENTPPKTTASVNSSKKQTKKSEIATTATVKDSTSKTKEVVSSTTKAAAPKPVIGKPYATANYTKGNTYLAFGSFKIPTHAVKLKKDLNKLGMETDVINVDGAYKVVVSYTNKEKALSAAKDYPNTAVFE